MASMFALQEPRLLTAEEFLEIDFGPELKAELDRGVILLMAGGSRDHSRVQVNILVYLGRALRGSGCRAYGPDMKVRSHDMSVRYPDVSVDCGTPADSGKDEFLHNLRVVVEVLSPFTRSKDEGVKLDEYRSLDTVDTILLVDPEAERCRVIQRSGPNLWTDLTNTTPADIPLPSIDLVLPHAEIFARD